MSATDVLKDLGFAEQETDELQTQSDEAGLSANYPHKVLHHYTRDDVTAVIEQNVSEDESGGVAIIMKHPPVLILESPKGRVAVSNHDDAANAELIANVVADLS
jgi:hypothetical protein